MKKFLFTAACHRAIRKEVPNDGRSFRQRIWNEYCLFRRLWLNPGIAEMVWAKHTGRW
jgi:hypothetical protein